MRCVRCGRALEDQAVYCGTCGRRSRVRRDSPAGVVLGDTYLVKSKLAEGGFGVIYRSTHLPSGLDVALKVLHADLAASPHVVARFRRESIALANLRDPHTVVTYERGEFRDGTPFIAMELLEGHTLLERLRERGRFPWRDALLVLRAVCSSLQEAHAAEIVHRDLKPANIHLGTGGAVKVLDFGVARCTPHSEVTDEIEITAVGQIVGTLDYMAPEQIVGVPCTPLSDIYSLGVIGFEMICGRRPFPDATSATSLMSALLMQSVPIPSRIAPVPPAVDRLLLRCLERDPDRRPRAMREVSDLIDEAIASERASVLDGLVRCALGASIVGVGAGIAYVLLS